MNADGKRTRPSASRKKTLAQQDHEKKRERVNHFMLVLEDERNPLSHRIGAYFTVLEFQEVAKTNELRTIADLVPDFIWGIKQAGGVLRGHEFEYFLRPEDGRIGRRLPTH